MANTRNSSCVHKTTNSSHTFCGAYARSTGKPCKAKALTNGRCKNHGGMSTGPKTPQGRRAVAEATRQRMLSGQRIRALEGYRSWLEGGGRATLSKLAIARERRKRWVLRTSPEFLNFKGKA